MALDYRKFKKINLKLDCFFLPFFLQAEATVLMQWYVIVIFLNESLTIAYCQYYNGINVGTIEATAQYIIEVCVFLMHVNILSLFLSHMVFQM
jgi:hypothetical protein